MLRVGLTGGIGSGKSTVAQRFLELGAVVVDADQLAREVVAVDSAGLGAIHQRFGDAVMAPDGSLDRGALGRVVFADGQALKDLEAITHPLIGARTRALMEAAAPHQIVVHEVPLLAELDLAPTYHLTVVVGADVEVRMARLTGARGFTQAEARARISAQVSDLVRRAAADAWLDNNGTVDGLLAQVDALWSGRIVGFNDNLMEGTVSRQPAPPAVVPYDDSWPPSAARLIRRVDLALGGQVVAVEHIGATSVPGLVAEDVIDLQIGVRALAEADRPEFVCALAEKGFPPSAEYGSAEYGSVEYLYGNADPARIARLHVRQVDGPAWRRALLQRDWLRSEAEERDAYGDFTRRLAESASTTKEFVEATQSWVDTAVVRAEAWARQLPDRWEAPSGWSNR